MEGLAVAALVVARTPTDSPESDENFWAFECIDTLVEKAPETALDFLLFALPRFTQDSDVAWLGAGPMENIIGLHGKRLIDRVELEARRDGRFRLLLSSIWGESSTDPEIWKRVQAAVQQGPWLDLDHRTPQGSDPTIPGKKLS